MPAWITSELRALVWLPISRSRSRTTTSRPAWRQRPRHREPDHARPDHHAPDPVHAALPRPNLSGQTPACLPRRAEEVKRQAGLGARRLVTMSRPFPTARSA